LILESRTFQKREHVDLRNIDLTIRRDGTSSVTQKTAAELAFEKRQKANQVCLLFYGCFPQISSLYNGVEGFFTRVLFIPRIHFASLTLLEQLVLLQCSCLNSYDELYSSSSGNTLITVKC
uniref:Uncharacterized protein n=1 Tax=Parascaris equorum TaxID=6256 RepID=A0A914R9G8_PAREQ